MNKSAASNPNLKFPKPGSDVVSVSEYKNIVDTEDGLQRQCDSLLKYYPDVRVIRIPDGLWKLVYRIANNILQKILGHCFGGMPDLVIFKKDGKFNSCLMVELKVKGRQLRQNQKKWAAVLNVYKIEFFEDFEELFFKWYNIKPRHDDGVEE